LLHGIEQVIDYSRSTAAWPGNLPRVVDLGAVLAHLQDEFAATAIGKGIGLTIQLPDRALDPWADPAAVSHLLTQIVGNAVHTTGHGRVTVAATATATEVRIAIADTRAGSAATALTAAYGAIDQTTRAPARVQGGFGLGLAIAHQLNNVPGGRIEVTSPPDQGTTVTLTLPLARPRVATHTSPATSAPPMRPRGPGLLSELPALFVRTAADDRVPE
jgi:signal transduction histidine kinase